MRRFGHDFLVALVLMLLFLPGGAAGDEFGRDGTLMIFVRSNKPIYEFGEPIVLTLKLKNNTTEPLIVNRRFDPFHDLQWELFLEPTGFLPIKTVPSKPLAAEDYVPLKPEDHIERVLPHLSEIISGELKPGMYGVRITYINKEKPKGAKTWTGEIITNRLSFQIKPSKRT